MGIDITVKIGGEAGQGIQTVGQLIALACQKAGLHSNLTIIKKWLFPVSTQAATAR